MRVTRWLLLSMALACSDPTAPSARAELVSGWWWVTLADGTVCLARPYQTPHRDTAAEAIAECEGARDQ